MSKKTSFHRFNQNIDQEPTAVSTNVQATSPKIEIPVFTPIVRVDESAPSPQIKPDAASLKDLFSQLGTLLSEEPINTNPAPNGAFVPAGDPDPIPDQPTEEEDEELPVVPAKVEEARMTDIHSVADAIAAPRPTPAPTQAPAPVAGPVVQVTAPVEVKPKKWIFKVVRNQQGLIDTIEATSN